MVLVAALSLSAQNYYNGSLDVEMGGTSIVKGQATRVSLTEATDGTYTFRLPDFRISINDMEIPCGDIVVEGVTRTANADGYAIAGSVNDLSLAEGEIHAKVEVAGTESTDGKMNLTITVGWYSAYPDVDDPDTIIPINVTFAGEKTAAVSSVATDNVKVFGMNGAIAVNGFNGRAYVYSVDGRLVATANVNTAAELPMAKGLYVVRTANKATKVIVK